MKIQDYCETKKYDCSDCEINKNHESGNCEKLFDAYTLGYNKAIDDAKSIILQTLDNEVLVDTLHLRLEQLKVGGESE